MTWRKMEGGDGGREGVEEGVSGGSGVEGGREWSGVEGGSGEREERVSPCMLYSICLRVCHSWHLSTPPGICTVLSGYHQ